MGLRLPVSRSEDDGVPPPLGRGQRMAYAGVMLVGGGAMAIAGLWQLAGLVRTMRALPPTITVYTGLAGLVPMGIAIAGFGTLALGPSATEAPRRHGKPAPGLDRAQKVTALALACLALFPVLTVALRLGTADYLEGRGYHREAADPGFHARFLSIRWSRIGPSSSGG